MFFVCFGGLTSGGRSMLRPYIASGGQLRTLTNTNLPNGHEWGFVCWDMHEASPYRCFRTWNNKKTRCLRKRYMKRCRLEKGCEGSLRKKGKNWPCTDENGLGTGLVRYRFYNVRYTIPGFFRDMHKASPYRCNRPFGVCKPLLTLLIWCVLNPGYLIYIVTNTDAKIQKYLHPTAGMRQKSS